MSNGKSTEAYYQCSKCGGIHKLRCTKGLSDSTYESIWCSGCRQVTRQLYCGTAQEDIYELYDVTMDERYYKYNKTK